jgi:hypothetical protein
MPNADELGRSTASGQARSRGGRRQPRSAGESQMAVTAIDHGGRVVTVTSQPVEIASAKNTPHSVAFATVFAADLWMTRRGRPHLGAPPCETTPLQ